VNNRCVSFTVAGDRRADPKTVNSWEILTDLLSDGLIARGINEAVISKPNKIGLQRHVVQTVYKS